MIEEAHRDAFWVITVVGGLSVTKALEESIPVISLSNLTLQSGVIMLRLFVFLILVVRFFIGASVFFHKVHITARHSDHFPKRNYVVDFASTIIHFSLFYWMALGVASVTGLPESPAREQFFIALSFVLLYDWAWLLMSFGYSTKSTIRYWARYNTVTLVPCLIVFIAFMLGAVDRAFFEISIAIFMFLFGLPDMIRMASGALPA